MHLALTSKQIIGVPAWCSKPQDLETSKSVVKAPIPSSSIMTRRSLTRSANKCFVSIKVATTLAQYCYLLTIDWLLEWLLEHSIRRGLWKSHTCHTPDHFNPSQAIWMYCTALWCPKDLKRHTKYTGRWSSDPNFLKHFSARIVSSKRGEKKQSYNSVDENHSLQRSETRHSSKAISRSLECEALFLFDEGKN